jgi:hypothetical protein
MLRHWILSAEHNKEWDSILDTSGVKICITDPTDFLRVQVIYAPSEIRATAFIKRERLDAVDQG